ncbi:MAG: hypothetical protein KAX49_18845 [Halanaerobiales bacterium]|nr:hypothetical protein [Halanaerobiales bacterium]
MNVKYLKDCYWEGNNWSVVIIGRIGEVQLNSGDERYTYMLIFSGESEGELFSERIANYLRNLNVLKIKSRFEEYIQTLGCRTILDKDDLLMIQQGASQMPEFYKQALKGDITKIIIF